jgi:uncharacterized protein (TIGR02147 family)
MEPTSPTCFRGYLQEELLKRCRTNRGYSLRAFARALDIESSALSKILNGKRAVTPKMYARLSSRLNLSPSEQLEFDPKKSTFTKEVERRTLTNDLFQVIADWYHYAILELTQLDDFQGSPRWIAKTLGITATEATIAIERLQRLEFLKITEDGTWTDQSGAITTVGTESTTAAFRKLQSQIIEKAAEALRDTPIEERDQSSMTFAANSVTLPVAKEDIKAFRRNLAQKMSAADGKDTVYHLSVSLYPVTQTKRNGNNEND